MKKLLNPSLVNAFHFLVVTIGILQFIILVIELLSLQDILISEKRLLKKIDA
jgi:hypothetical protein